MPKNQMKQPDEVKAPESNSHMPHTLRGMRDVLPDEARLWRQIFQAADKVADEFRFERVIVPVAEQSMLFERSVKEEVVKEEKEVYTFLNGGSESISLRPEFAASLARAYFEHGMQNRPQPVRIWDCGPIFHCDHPQGVGRFKQAWQMDFEILGEVHPVADALLIQAASAFFSQLSIPVTLAVNSVGDRACRKEYTAALVQFIKGVQKDICATCQQKSVSNPLHVLGCHEALCQAALAEAPQMVDWLCHDCRQHFVQVLEYLDEFETPYVLESKLMQGQDVFSRTVFEFSTTSSERQADDGSERPVSTSMVIGAGGRRDVLFAGTGNKTVPTVGFMCGIERIAAKIQERNTGGEDTSVHAQIFIAQLGNEARKVCLRLYKELRGAGYHVAESFNRDGLSHQLEVATRLQCRYTLILGQKELMDKTIIIRDMESGIQEIVDFNKVVSELSKRVQHIIPSITLSGFSQTIVSTEVKKIDLRREEFLMNQSVVQEDEGEAEVVTVSEQVGEETEWLEEHETRQGEGEVRGLKWVSEDYRDEDEETGV